MTEEYYLTLIYKMQDSDKQYTVTQKTDHIVMAHTQFKGLSEWAKENPLLSGWFIVLFENGMETEFEDHNIQNLSKLDRLPGFPIDWATRKEDDLGIPYQN